MVLLGRREQGGSCEVAGRRHKRTLAAAPPWCGSATTSISYFFYFLKNVFAGGLSKHPPTQIVAVLAGGHPLA